MSGKLGMAHVAARVAGICNDVGASSNWKTGKTLNYKVRIS